MNVYKFNYRGFDFKRISKKTARRAYNNGLTVMFCPVNLNPFNGVGFGAPISKADSDGRDFDTVVNSFEYYNCINSETGVYTAFYIPFIVNSFDGREQYDYRYLKA